MRKLASALRARHGDLHHDRVDAREVCARGLFADKAHKQIDGEIKAAASPVNLHLRRARDELECATNARAIARTMRWTYCHESDVLAVRRLQNHRLSRSEMNLAIKCCPCLALEAAGTCWA